MLSSNLINYGLLFITSAIIFRNVDKSDYGLYVILLSLFALAELFMGGYNQAIARFIKEKIPLKDKQQIILYTFYYKYLVLAVFLILSFIFVKYDLLEFLINDFASVSNVVSNFFYIVIVNSIVSIFVGISTTTLTSLFKYRFVNNLEILRNITYLVIVLNLVFYTNDYMIYLCVNTSLNILILVILSYKMYREFNEYTIFSLLKLKLDISIYSRYLLSYATPLTMVSIITYVKNHLPIIILGKEFELENVAVFAIMKNFFKAMHSLIGSFVNSLTSKFITFKENEKKFKLVMNSLYYSNLIIRTLIYIVLIMTIKYFFMIYKLDNMYINHLIFYILGFEFIIAGIMDNYGIVLNLGKSTKNLLYIGIIKMTFELVLIYYLLFDYGVLAAALIVLLSRYFTVFISYFFIRKNEIFKLSFIIIMILLPIVFYFLAEVSVSLKHI